MKLRQLSIAFLLFAVMLLTPVTTQAQTAASPFGLSPLYNAADQVAFNAAYKASLPPALAAYMALPYNAFTAGSATALTRTTPAVLRAANQFALDTQIAVWGQDPYMTDLVRIVQGYGWVPSFGQPNIPIGPGLSMPENPYTYNAAVRHALQPDGRGP